MVHRGFLWYLSITSGVRYWHTFTTRKKSYQYILIISLYFTRPCWRFVLKMTNRTQLIPCYEKTWPLCRKNQINSEVVTGGTWRHLGVVNIRNNISTGTTSPVFNSTAAYSQRKEVSLFTCSRMKWFYIFLSVSTILHLAGGRPVAAGTQRTLSLFQFSTF